MVLEKIKRFLCGHSSDHTADSRIPIYRHFEENYTKFNDTKNLIQTAKYFPDKKPIWFGSAEPGNGKIPLYLFENSLIGATLLSTSETSPWFGDYYGGFVIGNNSQPYIYIYEQPGTGLVPLYRLVSNSHSQYQRYFTTGAGETRIDPMTFDFYYQLDEYTNRGWNTNSNRGLLGYVWK